MTWRDDVDEVFFDSTESIILFVLLEGFEGVRGEDGKGRGRGGK